MLQLLMKDIQISKRYLMLGFVGIGVFLFIINTALEGLPLIMSPLLLSYFIIVATNKSDEKNNNGRMLASLPVRRRDIVNAKYWSVLMFTASAFLLTLIWRLIIYFIFPQSDLPWFSLHSICIALIIQSIYFAIYYPIFFAFGARIVLIIEYILAFIAALIPMIFLSNLSDPETFIEKFSFENSILWLTIICLVMLFISWLISNLVYERRNI
ncbi:ABC-2 transporter permease [Paenibacillus psychroresistens]|uniref:ABC-2 transporter permease n=1 Tax=Paenibacillus psychroresistens TaxID=1778678 RepID=A0A6B8RDH8_9BACL|nr:ABC-2 transporter permease [Paenibacillus psychroresistens]QGQ94491.1 ABC-2 transporter permease [Paenibacillus psychroresistens]